MAQQDDQSGLIGDLIRLGVIETIDLAQAKVTVQLGEVLSPAVPWIEQAGAFRSWTPPAVGEQVLLLCPEGDIANGVVLRGIYSSAFPAPRNDAHGQILMPDGSTIDYDPDGHILAITLVGGSVTINAPNGVQIIGDVEITGKLTASVDVIGGGKSLKDHKHGGVTAGGAQTSAPV